jgi:ribosome-associated protein
VIVAFDIPDRELSWKFSPTGGPGGQHANKSSTRVELRFDVAASAAFDERTRSRIISRVGADIRILEDRSRSQATNRKRALRRLHALVDSASKPDPPQRKLTRPSRSARRMRLDDKRSRGQTKSLRRSPGVDD